jgi:hypothetical protein
MVRMNHGGLHTAALHGCSLPPYTFVTGNINFLPKNWSKFVVHGPDLFEDALKRPITTILPSITTTHHVGGLPSPLSYTRLCIPAGIPGIPRNPKESGFQKKGTIVCSFFAGTSRKSRTDRAVTCKNRLLFCRNVHTKYKAKLGLVKCFFDDFAVGMLVVLHENTSIKSNRGWQRWFCLSSAFVGGNCV